MAVIRAHCIFENESGLPEDRSTNTFHFNGPTDEATLEAIQDALWGFYFNTPAGSVLPLTQYLSTGVVSFYSKLYDVTLEPSGPPLAVRAPYAVDTADGIPDLPEQVAMCLSFRGTPEAGLVQSRRRGRVYIGPLNQNAREAGGSSPVRPAAQFMSDLRKAGAALATTIDADAEWVIYSRPFAGRVGYVKPNGDPMPDLPPRAGSTVNIDEVWTDDRFDTQRRRLIKPTAKTFLTTGE